MDLMNFQKSELLGKNYFDSTLIEVKKKSNTNIKTMKKRMNQQLKSKQ